MDIAALSPTLICGLFCDLCAVCFIISIIIITCANNLCHKFTCQGDKKKAVNKSTPNTSIHDKQAQTASTAAHDYTQSTVIALFETVVSTKQR